VVLDNGSADETPEVIRRLAGSFAPGRFERVALPVNVGAPAARNWLLALTACREAAWVAFLDDDLVLPPDWLVELLSAAATDPGASAIGCRITDAVPPFGVQSADYHLLPREWIARSFDDLPERLAVNNFGGTADTGLFAYTRPCLSVTGCCHLIRPADGGFDLKFTPTQFDDLDRDLGVFLKGGHALYHGRLAVLHRQHSSLRQAASAAASAQVLAHKLKLEFKHTGDEPGRILARQWPMLAKDLAQKARRLARMA